ncbi:MAG: O-antigen ligase family protein [Gammaproteobacteria bacterium]|nr:O-antigen ligase family protein [Gammaproteobacteria bacterium]MBU1446707.1 O-antigen ligase family protein [Gammaproteobacteria bacterium]
MSFIIFAATCFVFFLLALIKPKIVLLMLLGSYALWPAYVAFLIPGAGGVNPQRILSLLLIVAWIIQMVQMPSMRSRLLEVMNENRAVFLSAAIYFMFGIITAIISSAQPAKSMSSAVITFISYPMIMIFVISYFSKRKEIIQLFFTIIILAISTEIIGIAEWMNGGNIFAIFIDPVSDIAEQMMQGAYRDEAYRIQSTFTNPLSFAEFLLLVMPISLYFIRPRQCGVAIRLFAAIQIVLGMLCIYLTASRASILLVVMMISFLLGWSFRNKVSKTAVVMSTSLVVLLVAAIVPWGALITYVVGDASTINSTLGRLYQLQAGIPAVLSSPLWGYGLGQGVNFVAPLVAIDNYYLTVALETGLTGLLLLLAFQVNALKLSLRTQTNTMFPSLGFFVGIALVGLFINELTLSIIQSFTFLFAIVGALMVIQMNERSTYITARNE